MNTSTLYEHRPGYLFLSGVVKSMENMLITTAQLERMRQAKEVSDLLAVLSETVYADLVPAAGDILSFEEQLQTRLFQFEAGLLDLVADDNLKKVFMVDYDFHNIKLFLSSHLTAKPLPDNNVAPGYLDAHVLKNCIFEADFSDLPELIAEAIVEAIELFERDRSIQKCLLFLDKKQYQIKLLLAERLHSPFLSDFFRSDIDLSNCTFYFRAKNMEFDLAYLSAILLDGGSLPKHLFTDFFDATVDAFAEQVKHTDFFPGIQEGVAEFKEKQSIASLERFQRNFLLHQAKDLSNHLFGFEPLVGLIYAKRYEVLNVKIMLIARQYGLPETEIDTRLGDSYVS